MDLSKEAIEAAERCLLSGGCYEDHYFTWLRLINKVRELTIDNAQLRAEIAFLKDHD